jgi:chromate transporter
MEGRLLSDLFLTFAKIGAFTFGGGYAMIPLIQREVVDKKNWISNEDILDVIAIAESTPGPIAINSATFIGKKVAGIKGAVAATAGVVLPSFLIIIAVSFVLEAFQHIKAVRYAFWGIRAGVLALILKALWSMFSVCNKNGVSYAVMALAFLLVSVLKLSVILVIVICALLGILYTQGKKVRR